VAALAGAIIDTRLKITLGQALSRGVRYACRVKIVRHTETELVVQESTFWLAALTGKYQATVILWLVIDRDGLPTHIRVQRPAGMGLDEEAFDSVRTWKFEPATKDGRPVPVMINVEVNFKLY
jgi:TonB family protein